MSSAASSRSLILIAAFGLAALATAPALGAVDPAGAAKLFREAKVLCERDGGRLWGKSLCGPIMLVDP